MIIVRFNPLFLSLVDYNYFHNISKASEKGIPWTGCLTYISKELAPIEFPEKFSQARIEELGSIIYTSEVDSKGTYAINVDSALELEQFLINKGIKNK